MKKSATPIVIPVSLGRICPECWVVFLGRVCPKCGGKTSHPVAIGQIFFPVWKTVREVWDRAEDRLGRRKKK